MYDLTFISHSQTCSHIPSVTPSFTHFYTPSLTSHSACFNICIFTYTFIHTHSHIPHSLTLLPTQTYFHTASLTSTLTLIPHSIAPPSNSPHAHRSPTLTGTFPSLTFHTHLTLTLSLTLISVCHTASLTPSCTDMFSTHRHPHAHSYALGLGIPLRPGLKMSLASLGPVSTTLMQAPILTGSSREGDMPFRSLRAAQPAAGGSPKVLGQNRAGGGEQGWGQSRSVTYLVFGVPRGR